MGNTRNRHPARRRFLKQTAALTARAAVLSAPVAVMAKVAGGGEEPVQDSQPSSGARPLRDHSLAAGAG